VNITHFLSRDIRTFNKQHLIIKDFLKIIRTSTSPSSDLSAFKNVCTKTVHKHDSVPSNKGGAGNLWPGVSKVRGPAGGPKSPSGVQFEAPVGGLGDEALSEKIGINFYQK